jgi:hypothetical protein
VEEFVRYIDKLNSEDRMNLFHVVNASLGEKECELTLSIKSSEPELSSDWLISISHHRTSVCVVAHYLNL